MFKLHFKFKSVVVKFAFLFYWRWIASQSLKTKPIFFVLPLIIHLLNILVVIAIGFFYPVFLVAVSSCRHGIFLPSLNFCFDKLELFWADTHPFWVLARLRLVHYSLKKLIFAVTWATCDAWLCEVHQFKEVLAVLASVSGSKVEPLLVASRICVHLHIKAVLTGRYSIGSQKITRLKNCIDQHDIPIVFANQSNSQFF